MQEIRQKLYQNFQQELDDKSFDIYIEPFALIRGKSEAKVPVLQIVKNFIQSNQQSLLVLGDSGMDKTLLATKVVHTLWQDENALYWPIYIYLPTLVDKKGALKEKLLETHFKDNCGLEWLCCVA